MLYSSFHAFSYDILLKKGFLNCPYSSGVLRRNTWLAGELAGRWRAGKLFILPVTEPAHQQQETAQLSQLSYNTNTNGDCPLIFAALKEK